MRPGRWRIRFLLVALVTLPLIGALAFAQRATLRHLEGRLSDALGQQGANAITEEVAEAFTVTGMAAIALSGIFAFIIGHVVARQLATMRADTLARSRGEPGPPITRPPIAELQALAAAIELLATEQARRARSLTGERDDLALLVNSVSEGMLQVGPDGRIVHANPAARRLLGLPSGVTGEPLAAVVRNAELRSFLDRALGGEAVGSCEITLDDRRMLVDVSIIQRGLAGEAPPLGTVIAFTDLTEIRRLEGVRRDFVANVSHEIKTPLTSIRGYVETLMTDDLPPEVARQFLDVIQKNAERLHGIVDDLLDLSRLESGGWRPQLESLDPLPIAHDVWTAAQESADRKNIDFRMEGADTAVVADASALRHVFSNLFDNAVRYTPAGGRITVRVGPARHETSAGTPDARTAESQAPPRRLVTIDVQDTGTGIPHEALARIFERFYRVDPARSRAEGGTGLGLSIVKHLVESMGGEVTAHSALGKGTTLSIRLPAA